jgi:hypothetical protein
MAQRLKKQADPPQRKTDKLVKSIQRDLFTLLVETQGLIAVAVQTERLERTAHGRKSLTVTSRSS